MFNKELMGKGNLPDWEEIRYIQKSGSFMLPSDFIYVALNYNSCSIAHDSDEIVKVKLINGDFDFFDIFQDVREISEEMSILEIYEESDNLILRNQFLPIVQTGSRAVFLIGNTIENLNEIFYFSPVYDSITERNYSLFKQSENIFELINEQVFISRNSSNGSGSCL